MYDDAHFRSPNTLAQSHMHHLTHVIITAWQRQSNESAGSCSPIDTISTEITIFLFWSGAVVVGVGLSLLPLPLNAVVSPFARFALFSVLCANFVDNARPILLSLHIYFLTVIVFGAIDSFSIAGAYTSTRRCCHTMQHTKLYVFILFDRRYVIFVHLHCICVLRNPFIIYDTPCLARIHTHTHTCMHQPGPG